MPMFTSVINLGKLPFILCAITIALVVSSGINTDVFDEISSRICPKVISPIGRSQFYVHKLIGDEVFENQLSTVQVEISVSLNRGCVSHEAVIADFLYINTFHTDNDTEVYIAGVDLNWYTGSGDVITFELTFLPGNYTVCIKESTTSTIFHSVQFFVVEQYSSSPWQYFLFPVPSDAKSTLVSIGRGSYGVRSLIKNHGIIILDDEPWEVVIGSFCSISLGVTLLMAYGGGHDYKSTSTYPFSVMMNLNVAKADRNEAPGKVRKVTIGNDVWIGYGARIVNTVNVGHGAVIGAHAVVREDVPPYSIVVGNPATVVKYRFADEIIQKLLKIRWWDWTDKQIIDSRIYEVDIQAFVDTHYSNND